MNYAKLTHAPQRTIKRDKVMRKTFTVYPSVVNMMRARGSNLSEIAQMGFADQILSRQLVNGILELYTNNPSASRDRFNPITAQQEVVAVSVAVSEYVILEVVHNVGAGEIEMMLAHRSNPLIQFPVLITFSFTGYATVVYDYDLSEQNSYWQGNRLVEGQYTILSDAYHVHKKYTVANPCDSRENVPMWYSEGDLTVKQGIFLKFLELSFCEDIRKIIPIQPLRTMV